MSNIGVFIGVDRYQDQDIRDLSGAKNDALALWALFKDTLDIKAELLIGTEATIQNITSSLKAALLKATPDDAIIVLYSGHGSPDHRITGFDTQLNHLDSTTISMKWLAELFKESKAAQIFFILDCCFSGGAPAKVLEDAPIPRELGNPLKAFEGEGRIILAASNFDQPSYELANGHGILTKAIIDVLMNSDNEQVNLLVAINEILSIVRAEASRIGVEQTPVMLNHVTGGLNLKRLTPGANYYKFFPQRKGIKVSRDIHDLVQFGLAENLTSEWIKFFPLGLNPLQLEAINEYRILDGDSVLVIAPTSSGKTFVGELAGAWVISQGKKAIFLFPYKALVNEKYDQFVDLYQNKLGYRVIRCTGDYLDQNNEFIKGKYDIALFTYEMFLNLSISLPMVLLQIGLVVLDEAQFITDPSRGISVELLLTNLISARLRGITPQLVVLSAVIGDSNYFEDWLGCRKLMTTKRPVPLIEGVMGRNGVFTYLDENGEIKEEQFLSRHAISQRRTKPSQQDVIVPLVKTLVSKGEKIIVFRNQKGSAEGCANYLAEELGLPSATSETQLLPRHLASSASPKLRACFNGGTAFHNSNLSREERRVVEKVFRSPNSNIRVLAATTTVAAGINTPASTAILAENVFVGDDGRPFTIAEYKNMAGRAGRVGFNEIGRSIILADAEHSPEFLFNKYVLGKPEPLVSSFNPSHLDTWLLKLLAQVKDIHKDELINLLSNTYGGYTAIKANPEWEKRMRLDIQNLFDEMIRLNIVEEENGIVHLTILGKVCGESALSFRSALRLIDLLRMFQQAPTPLQLMAIVQALPESDNIYIPMFKKGTSESRWIVESSRRIGGGLVSILQKYVNGDSFTYYARCKKASLLFDWVNGVTTAHIEETFKSNNPFFGNITYGNIRNIADFTRFLLRSAYKITAIMYPGELVEENAFDNLLKSLETGIPADSLGLLESGLEMSREEYLALALKDIKTKEALLHTPLTTLETLLEQNTIQAIINHKELIATD